MWDVSIAEPTGRDVVSTDLRSQLVEYGVQHRDQQTPVSLDEIMALGEKVRPIPVAHPPQQR